jgi:hypothetical protein
MLQPPRAIPIPPQPKLQPRLQAPPQVIAAWSKSARSLASKQLPTATARASPKVMPVVPVVPPVTTSPEPVTPPKMGPSGPAQQPSPGPFPAPRPH